MQIKLHHVFRKECFANTNTGLKRRSRPRFNRNSAQRQTGYPMAANGKGFMERSQNILQVVLSEAAHTRQEKLLHGGRKPPRLA